MLVRDILNKKGNKVFTASPDTLIGNIAITLAKENIGAVVILDNDLVVGILSERDVVRGFTQYESVRKTKAKELMTKKVVSCTKKNTTEELLELMVKKHFRHMPVIENNKLIGVISIGDLVKDRTKRLKKEIDQLKSYVTKSY
tara:strand:- start:169 stop:597 length:429 start_codon:yes stop_codon:yes gene_type:complete